MSLKENALVKEFIGQSIFRIMENGPRIEKCLDQLNEVEVWHRPNSSCNSIANLLLHLSGNIRQYIISSLGEQPDTRIRDEEFSTTAGLNKEELFLKLSSTVNDAVTVLKIMNADDLLKNRLVQGFEMTGIAIVIHVVEHYSYHTGQIAYWTKIIKDKDLGFYAGKDLNRKNKI